MANNCYNYIEIISTDKEEVKLIKKAFESYKDFDSVDSWGDSFISKRCPIDDRIENIFHKYGSKWFDFDIEVNDDGIVVSGDSAWAPMEMLLCGICFTFGVEGSIEYSEPGCDFGGRTTFDARGRIIDYLSTTYSEWESISMGSEWVSESLAYTLEDNIDDYDNFNEFISEYDFITDDDDIDYLKDKFFELKYAEALSNIFDEAEALIDCSTTYSHKLIALKFMNKFSDEFSGDQYSSLLDKLISNNKDKK